MTRGVVIGIVGVLVLVGCDSAGNDGEDAPAPAPAPSPEVETLCRGVYERLPPPSREATTEDEFIEQCVMSVRGAPDPVRIPRT